MPKLSRLSAILLLGLTMILAHTLVWGARGVAAQSCSSQAVVLDDGPIAYWRLAETSGPAVNIGNLGSAVDGTYAYPPGLGTEGLVPRDPDLASHSTVGIPSHNQINTGGPYTAKTIELWFETFLTHNKQVLYEQGDTTHGLNVFLDGDQLTVGAWVNDNGGWINTTVAPGTIYYVALVFDGNAQTLIGYLNGESFGSLATGFTSVPSHSGGIGIGVINDDTRFSNSEVAASGLYLDGVIDEVALHNHALSPTRIQLHARGCTVLGPAVDVAKHGPVTASVNDTVPYTFTLTNIGDTPLENVQVEDDYAGAGTGNYVDGDDNHDGWLDLTETWVYTAAYSVQPTDPNPLINTVTVTATDALSAEVTHSNTHALYILSTQGCDYQTNVLDDNPIAYWPLAETSGPATNISSLGNVPDGTYQNGVTRGVNGLMPGAPNSAVSFDGYDDYVSFHSHNEINASGPYVEKTIELWFKADVLTGKQILFEEGGNINGLNVYLDGNLLYVGAWAHDSGSWIATTIEANTVYHVALVFDGNAQTVTGYLDGVSFGSQTVGFSSIPTHPGQIGTAGIDVDTRYSNSEYAITLNGAHFAGVIDDVALYNHVLPANRIQLHADGCSFSDAPDLELTKDDGGISVTPGGVVTYTLSYANSGTLDASGVIITDTVPANTTFNAAASSPGWSCADGSPAGTSCTFSIGSLASGANDAVTFAITVDGTLLPGVTQIENTATVGDDGANGDDQNPSDNQASDSTPITVDLTVNLDGDGSVTLDPAGDSHGTGTVVTLTPGANPGWFFAGWSGPDAGDLTDNANGTWSIMMDDDKTVTATFTELLPDLTLSVTDGGTSTTPGGTVTYTLSYANIGNQVATGVTISETVPANTTFNLAGSSIDWSCTDGSPAGTACIFSPGSLDAGANGSAKFAVTVEDPLSAAVIQIATAASITDDGTNGPDHNPDDNRGSDTTEIEVTTGGTRIFLPLILSN